MRGYPFLSALATFTAFLGLTGAAHGQIGSTPWQLQTHLREHVMTLAMSPDSVLTSQLTTDPQKIWRVYANRKFAPMWFDSYGLKPEWVVFRDAVATARSDGLLPQDYFSDDLENRLSDSLFQWAVHGSPDYVKLSRLELLMTDRLLRYASHVSIGQARPKLADPEWHAKDKPLPEKRLLSLLSDGTPLNQLFEQLQPRHSLFKALRSGLQEHYRIQSQGGWGTIPPGPIIRRGDRGERVRVLRRRLISSHDMEDTLTDASDRFDGTLEAAVQHFQRRHGLVPDGLVGGATLAALNVPVEVRISQILLNLERLRWLPADLGIRYLFVNIAEFRLHLVQAETVTETLDVIVGRKDRPTPSLSSRMRYMILNPYWFIPPPHRNRRHLAQDPARSRIPVTPAYSYI